MKSLSLSLQRWQTLLRSNMAGTVKYMAVLSICRTDESTRFVSFLEKVIIIFNLIILVG